MICRRCSVASDTGNCIENIEKPLLNPSQPAMATYYTLPEEIATPFWRRGLSFGWAAAVHIMLLLGLVSLAARPDLVQPLQALTVRMLDLTPTPKVEPPKPRQIPRPAPRQPKAPLPPAPVIAAATPATTASSFIVAPQTAPRPAEAQPAAPASAPTPAPIVAARFDADYLQNPTPVYPLISRRMGEEGKVVLRVRVSAQGGALAVDIRQSSGFTRLDEAARNAVEKWRFVPARQGNDAIEATVLVPLHFKLDS